MITVIQMKVFVVYETASRSEKLVFGHVTDEILKLLGIR